MAHCIMQNKTTRIDYEIEYELVYINLIYLKDKIWFYGRATLIAEDYADNTAAIAGGLAVGEVYRTGDLLKIVH